MKLTAPTDAATASAMDRAANVLAALIFVLGEGSHQLNIVGERTDNAFVSAAFSVSVGMSPMRVDHSAEDYVTFFAVLTFALENSTMRRAVLVATTADEPFPRACGWSVHDGQLHPMDRRELQAAVMPHPGAVAPLRLVYDAPPLPEFDEDDAHE